MVKVGEVVALWIILKVTTFAGWVRKQLRIVSPWKAGVATAVKGKETDGRAGFGGGGSSRTGTLGTLRHLDGEVDLLAGYRS